MYNEAVQLSLLREYVGEFKDSQNHVCWLSAEVKGRCDSVATDLYYFLKDKGLNAQLIEGRGLIPELPDDAHPEWIEFLAGDSNNRRFLIHVVVRVEGQVIDLTGSQFGTGFQNEIYPIQQFKRHWGRIHPFKPWR